MPDQAVGLLSPWLRQRRLDAALPFLRGRVLDFGCGVGALAGFCAPGSYLEVDADTDSIALARQRHPGHRFESEVPPEECFDTIVLLAVIEHVPDPAGLLRRLKPALSAGGRLILTTPAPALESVHALGAQLGLFSSSAHEEHQDLIDSAAMRRLAAEAGFIFLESRTFLFGCNQLFVLSEEA